MQQRVLVTKPAESLEITIRATERGSALHTECREMGIGHEIGPSPRLAQHVRKDARMLRTWLHD